MFKKILYPTNFSEFARKALDYIKKLREAGSEEVVILHVVEKEIVEAYKEAFVWAGKDVTTETEKLDEKMRKQMKEDIKELEGLGFSVKRLITILKVAEGEDVSLIVMGSHGCGRLS